MDVTEEDDSFGALLAGGFNHPRAEALAKVVAARLGEHIETV